MGIFSLPILLPMVVPTYNPVYSSTQITLVLTTQVPGSRNCWVPRWQFRKCAILVINWVSHLFRTNFRKQIPMWGSWPFSTGTPTISGNCPVKITCGTFGIYSWIQIITYSHGLKDFLSMLSWKVNTVWCVLYIQIMSLIQLKTNVLSLFWITVGNKTTN